MICCHNAGTGADTQVPSPAAAYAVSDMSCKLRDCFVMLCSKAAVSMPPTVCLFLLFSCCLLSWFFQFNWNLLFNLLCSFWLCISQMLIAHLLSPLHVNMYIVSQEDSKVIANIFQNIQLGNNFFCISASIMLYKASWILKCPCSYSGIFWWWWI